MVNGSLPCPHQFIKIRECCIFAVNTTIAEMSCQKRCWNRSLIKSHSGMTSTLVTRAALMWSESCTWAAVVAQCFLSLLLNWIATGGSQRVMVEGVYGFVVRSEFKCWLSLKTKQNTGLGIQVGGFDPYTIIQHLGIVIEPLPHPCSI